MDKNKMKIRCCKAATESEIKTVGSTMIRNWATLLSFEILYQTVVFFVVEPSIRFLFHRILGMAGQRYFSLQNIGTLFQHPLALLLGLAVLLFIGLVGYYEITALFLYSEKSWRQEDLGLWSLCKDAAVRTCGLLRPSRFPVFSILPILLVSFLSLHIWIPGLITGAVKSGPLFFALAILLFLLFHLGLFFYFFGLPVLLFEGKSFAASWKESRRLMKHNPLRLAGTLAAYLLLVYIILGLLTLIGIFLLAGGVHIFCMPENYRICFQQSFLVLQNIGGRISGVLGSAFLCAVCVAFYHRQRNDPRPISVRTSLPARRNVSRVAAILTAAAIFAVFCRLDIGSKIRRLYGSSAQIVAHRAGSAFAPENTVAALRQAIRAGVAMAEIDVQLLKDGTLIVLHDTNFKRTTGLDLELRDADYETVKQLDAGSFFSSAFAGEPIPTLEEMLRAAKGRIRLMLELKAGGYTAGLEEKTLRLIEEYGMKDQCVIASMNLDILERMNALAPELPTIYITALQPPEQYDQDLPNAYSVKSVSLSAEKVRKMHSWEKAVYAWTINSEETLQKILRYGVDGIITDNPVLAKSRLRGEPKILSADRITDFFFPQRGGS